MSVTTDVIYKVWHDKEGVCVEIGPNPDGIGLVLLRTVDVKSVEYFGKLHSTFEPAFARAIGNALLRAADEAEPFK